MGFMRITGLSALLVGLMVVSSCGTPATKPPKAERAAPAPVMKVGIAPADKATDLPISTEIGTSVTDGEIQTVTLADAQGHGVAGNMRADKSSFVPDEPLKFAQTYTATVVAKGADRVDTLKTTFTTMAEPKKRGETWLYLQTDVE